MNGTKSNKPTFLHQMKRYASDYWSNILDPKYCSFSGCTNRKAIRAHSVSKSKHLKTIAKDSHVYWTHFDPFTTLPFEKKDLKLEGINRATTFRGFCAQHDKLFSEIDEDEVSFEPKHLCLHAYRTAAAEAWWKLAAYKICLKLTSEKQLKEMPSDLLNSRVEMLESMLARNPGLQLSTDVKITPGTRYSKLDELKYHLEMSNEVRLKWETVLNEKKFDKVSAYTIKFEHSSPIASFIGHSPVHNFNGGHIHISMVDHPELPTCFIGILPEKIGSTFYIIWHSDSDEFIVPFVESLRQIPHIGKSDAILRLFYMQDGNLAISPDWWDNLQNPGKEFLQDILFYSKATGQSPVYLREGAITIEDWKVVFDGYLWRMPKLATRYIQFSNEWLPIHGKLYENSIVRKHDTCRY